MRWPGGEEIPKVDTDAERVERKGKLHPSGLEAPWSCKLQPGPAQMRAAMGTGDERIQPSKRKTVSGWF